MYLARARRVAVVVLLACAGSLSSWVLATASAAGTATARPVGWAWIAARSAASQPGSLSGVPAADVAVAWSGQPTKIAYVGSPPSADRGAVGLRLRVDPQHTPAVGADTAALQICLIVTPWAAAQPMAWDARPVTDCRIHAAGTWAPASREYQFDVAALVALLDQSQSAYGLSIEPAESAATPFDVAFLPPSYDDGGSQVAPGTAAAPVTPTLAPANPATEAAPLRAQMTVPAAAPPVPEVPVMSTATAAAPALAPAAAASGASSGRIVDFAGVYALLAVLGVLPAVAVAWRPGRGQVTA